MSCKKCGNDIHFKGISSYCEKCVSEFQKKLELAPVFSPYNGDYDQGFTSKRSE